MDFGKRPAQFVDRGDPDAWDWEKEDLAADGQWHDLDCSSIVPAGATHILFRIQQSTVASQDEIRLRKKGNQNEYNMAVTRQIWGNIKQEGQVLAACDANQVLQCFVPNTTIYDLNLLILGYYTQ